MLIGVMRIFLFSDHLNEVGMIKNGDGSLQDCHKALIHYDKLLVKQKFLVEEGIHLKKTFNASWCSRLDFEKLAAPFFGD